MNDRAAKVVVGIGCLYMAGWMAFWAFVLYAIVHFVLKLW
jgi:hypothetical protein